MRSSSARRSPPARASAMTRRVLCGAIAGVVALSVAAAVHFYPSSVAAPPAASAARRADAVPDAATMRNMPPGHRMKRYYTPVPSPSEHSPGWVLVGSMPHDSSAFTQGLEYRAGYFWEGTGMNGESNVRKVNVSTGAVLLQRDIPREDFGEGITIVNSSKLLQITWRTRNAYVYSWPQLVRQSAFQFRTHNMEGWGVCDDGTRIVVSDGSEYLTFWDRTTFAWTGEVRVVDPQLGNQAIINMNELECVEGDVLANIWYSNDIVRINPDTGMVVERLDMASLNRYSSANGAVLNGIAYDPASSNARDGYRLFITGKYWPLMHEIRWWPRVPFSPRDGA